MSEFHIVVTRLHSVRHHPNGDKLDVGKIFDYPVVFRRGEFSDGDEVIYIPKDSIVDITRPEFSFLQKPRIRAKRLRGIYSEGLILKPPEDWDRVTNLTDYYGITKYEEPIEKFQYQTEDEKDPGFLPVYTDIESLRKWPDQIPVGTEVVVLEKLHGQNGRWLFRDNRLWVGSHKRIKKEDYLNSWWKIAREYKLAEKLERFPGIALYGEVYGAVQDLNYGAQSGELFLALFDAKNTYIHRWFNYDVFLELASLLELPTVPVLYRGPWDPELRTLAEGPTTIPGANHIREGFVVKPVVEQFNYQLPDHRLVLKLVGEGYSTR